METLGEGEDGEIFNREIESWHQLPVEEDPSQFLGQTSGLLEADGIQGITLNSEGEMATMGDSNVQPAANRFEFLQLELQDSCLSPALTLIPQGKAFLPSEFTLLHQTDLEFVPLRGSPDLSIASERCSQMSRLDEDVESNLTHRSHEQASLSQHHLGTMSTILEDANSYCSLSQHSLSPGSNYQATQIHDEEHNSGLLNNDEAQKEGKEQTDTDLDGRGNSCGQKLLEKVLGVASSRISSSSETGLSQTDVVLRSTDSPEGQNKHSALSQKQDPACTSIKEHQFRPSQSREQPQGGSSSLLSQRRTMERGSLSLSTRLSAISNITVRSTVQHSESSLAAREGRNQTENKNTPIGQNVPLVSEGGGLQRALWSSGSNKAADGSFLTSQPVFQSTPAVLLGRGALVAARLSPVYSYRDNVASTQNSTPNPDDIPALKLSTSRHTSMAGVTIALNQGEAHTEHHEIPHSQEAPLPVLDVPVIADKDKTLDQPTLATLLPTSDQQLKDQEPRLSEKRVHSLPILSYVQKVDAWKANQSSSRSMHDSMSWKEGKEQDSVSEATKQQSRQHSNKTSSIFSANSSTAPTQTGSGVLSCADVEVAGGAVGSTSPSPFTHSCSHSSNGTVITPIQHDELQQNQNRPPLTGYTPIAISRGFNSTAAELSLSSCETSSQRPADDLGTGPLKPPALLNVDQYSGINVNNNMSNTIPNFQASIGAASSVVSLELDNYAPYWTSRPGSPRRPPEFNIEDRIPLYLHNLGIDQSPSTILNPFTQRGPIREPEYSPTDLCTIKGSVGTPTKSIQPSDSDSFQKETFSNSSVLSADSSASLTQLFIQQSLQQPTRQASSGSIKMDHYQTGILAEPLSQSHSVLHAADSSNREGSYGLPTQFSLQSAAGTLESIKEGDSSLVGSGTLQEIRRLLGHADSLVSGHSSEASFHVSHCYSESDASFLSLRQKTQPYHDDSFLSVDEKISLVLACSSSDSALKESSSSSSGPLELSTNSDHVSKGPTAPSLGREEVPKSRDICVAPRRAEPEGCSAADPDRVGPVSQSITQGNASSTSDCQQQSQDHTENAGIILSEISPTYSQTEAEMGVLSNGSSEHSLASRVAKLLQSESSVSVVTSRSSTADSDESQAREWIMMKVSSAKCESLDLNAEDRKRIEEIKRELLLCTKHAKSSSDSESSTQASVGSVPQPAVGFAAVHSAEDHLSEQLQRVCQIPLHTPPEDRVIQVGLKEGCNPEHTPSPQTANQCLYTHNSHASHNDKGQTKNEGGKGIMGKEKEVRDEDEHPDSERNEPLVIRGKREFPTGLESGLTLGHKPHFINSHFTPAVTVTLQQNTTQSPANTSSSYPELLTGSHTHQSESLNTSRGVSISVSSTNEEQQVSVSSETNSSKDRNTHQDQDIGMLNGYSQMSSRSPQAFTFAQRLAGPSRPLVNTTATTGLLPYKPHGSSELFYMPQIFPELSPNHSDTTVESSHPGSDDAVPPQFTPEVLGSRELMDNSVTPKHKEGIYSKRPKMKRESTTSGKGFHNRKGNTGLLYQHTAFSKTAVLENEQVDEQTEEGKAFIPLHVEANCSTTELDPNHRVQKHNMGKETICSLTKTTREKKQNINAQDLSAEIDSSLDQLWHRFNEQFIFQDTKTTNNLEISLLERLERLSRLLQGSTPLHTPSPAHSRAEKGKSRTREHEPRRTQGTDTTKNRKEQERNEVRERVQSDSVSVDTSSSQSTIDTQRLIKAFGAHRVGKSNSGREGVEGSQPPKPNDGLLKLYNHIKKQKRGHGKGSSENHFVSVATEISNTDDSMASETLSSSSTSTLPSQSDTGRTTSCKRAKVKLVSRSIQAGDLEIVVNGTRRDTRDVGTTFPSPGSARVPRTSSADCSEVKDSMSALKASSAVHLQPVLRKQAPSKQPSYPNGLSWFVSADELKWDARKENNPQTVAGKSEGQAWFEPYTRMQPWREPLRERHIQVERENSPDHKTHAENDSGNKPSSLVRLSLQEVLELRRPEFVSRSRERMKRLCLLAEERKMQAIFNKEREELFNHPSAVQQPKAAPAPPPLPSKRVIPVNEMIQRSKRIYSQLPEVQKRKEEERRKAEYNTYRLNAQLFNKKITNRVLGKRSPWQ
ncbi:Alstrom syndrome protein 1 isoform X2 [Tachysurus fulvidraco]|uniref:Alstrom syndrome protein 1 isoform X2 n=1 Tax=Tachysurus fulvidraco TaxID=1234273 RepID=UPI001FEF6898|nr:Alstrom syndrome protein 1 isoform X2 [Tachysurus fulvidraco]